MIRTRNNNISDLRRLGIKVLAVCVSKAVAAQIVIKKIHIIVINTRILVKENKDLIMKVEEKKWICLWR